MTAACRARRTAGLAARRWRAKACAAHLGPSASLYLPHSASLRSPPSPQGRGKIGASRRVGMLQHVEGEAVEVVQDLVHLVGAPDSGALAGRTAGTQRPDAASAACMLFFVLRACGVAAAGGSPAGEAPGLSRQVVQRRAERPEAERQAGRVERIVGRGRAAEFNGKRRGDAGQRDAGNAALRRPPGAEGPQRIEQRQGERAGRGGRKAARAASGCRCLRACAGSSGAASPCAGGPAAASRRAHAP